MSRRAALAMVWALLSLAAAPSPAHAYREIGADGQQRRNDARREQQYQQPQRRNDGDWQGQRLTPDERRQLRRDLHDANRDIRPSRRDGRQ